MSPKSAFEVRREANSIIDRVLGYRAFQVEIFIHRHKAKHGLEPTYDQIIAATGIKTRGEISRIVKSLERRGLVSRRTANLRGPMVVISGLPFGKNSSE